MSKENKSICTCIINVFDMNTYIIFSLSSPKCHASILTYEFCIPNNIQLSHFTAVPVGIKCWLIRVHWSNVVITNNWTGYEKEYIHNFQSMGRLFGHQRHLSIIFPPIEKTFSTVDQTQMWVNKTLSFKLKKSP